MKKQFPLTIEEVIRDDRTILLFADVGTFGFRNSKKEFPDRVINVGIAEQSMVSIAAGLALQDFIPIVHTINAFMVERALEQIKIDFGYQKLGGNFVSTGASYDMASWGCTHQCPGDVGILKNIPGMEIVIPGTDKEFDSLFKQSYDNGCPTYFRLATQNNPESREVVFGKANVIKKGGRATIIAVGPMLQKVEEACRDLDVTILYYTTLQPFDHEALRENINGDKIIVCEPYYSGACAVDISSAVAPRAVEIVYIGVPREFPHCYGTVNDLDAFFHLTTSDIKARVENVLTDK